MPDQGNSYITDEDGILYFMVDERKIEYKGPEPVPPGYSIIMFECDTPEDANTLNEALKKVKSASVKKG